MAITGYGYDVNQIGASDYPRTATRQIVPQKTGQVVDIIGNSRHDEYIKSNGSNLGYAKIKILPFDEGDDNASLNWVPPKEVNIQLFPRIGEEVIVEYIGGILTYSRALNRENNISDNTSIEINARYNSDPNKQNTEDTDINLLASGVRINAPSLPTKTSGYTPNTLQVHPEEGDFILQGRFGNIIRMGSSKFLDPTTYPLPNILLSVGQPANPISISTDELTEHSLTYEDINVNASTIWMVTDQLVPFESATVNSRATDKANLRGSEISRDKNYYSGAQIFINSDRLVLNSKQYEIQLFSNSEINLSAMKSITISSERSVLLSSNTDIKLKAVSDVFIRGSNISLVSTTGSISNNTPENYTILGKKIFIGSGEDTSQPMVLGGQLSVFFSELLTVLQLLPTVYVPQPTPLAATNASQIQTTLIKLFTDSNLRQAASFNSISNFTAKENRV